MSLPTPNLDDRTWASIVDEAKKLIPGLCPHWTDFNPSDPGIALVELMGWMTEMLLYRLNQVPEKNYIKFLELMGITLKPPESARTWLTFTPAEGAPSELLPVIPTNTQVSGIDINKNTVTFETTEPLNLNNSRLCALYTIFNEHYCDRSANINWLAKGPAWFDIFEEKEAVPHIFFLGEPALSKVGDEFSIRFSVTLEQPGIPLEIHWSCWNGELWQPLVPSVDETDGFVKSGSILFNYLPPMKPTKINGITSTWLRMRLHGFTGGPLPVISQFTKTLELKKTAGVMPEAGFFSTAEIPFMPILFQGTIMPFGQEAKESDTFYVGSRAFSRKGMRVTMDIKLAKSYAPPSDSAADELLIRWEYFSICGKWEKLGMSSPRGTLESAWSFLDHTEAFTHSGTIHFHVPTDIVALEINGIKLHWLRAVIAKGNYGTKKKKDPPICQAFLIKYRENPSHLEHYLAYDDFQYRELTPLVVQNQPFALYTAVNRAWPELYMGFDKMFSNNLHRLFLLLEQVKQDEARVVWEYPTPRGWKRIRLNRDDTHHFTAGGLVQFIGPPDWLNTLQFGKQAYWLRVRWEKYNTRQSPRMGAIILNAVKAINAQSHKNEILGSGNQQPFQQFSLKHTHSLLPNPRIIVRELESTIPDEIARFKKETREELVEELDQNTGQVKALWVEWVERDNFYNSSREARHYIFDHYQGTVTFGDGIRGRRLPIGHENVKARLYYTGGGATGNIGRHQLNNLHDAIPSIAHVTNPFTAAGGTDRESLDEAKLRAPWELKHRHRAVTEEDFEVLAMQAGGEVAYANCKTNGDGVVELLILPQEKPGDKGKLIPPPELLALVKEKLDKHRLITTRVKVIGPKYKDVDIWMEVALHPEAAHRTHQIAQQIRQELRTYVHPLKGKKDLKKQITGRPVYISDIRYIIESIDGIQGIEAIKANGYPIETKVSMPPDTIVYLANIDIKFKDN